MDTDADRRELIDEKPEEMDWREKEPILEKEPETDMQDQGSDTDLDVINHEEQYRR